MKKFIVMFKDKLSEKNEAGFSLIELVVAIGVILVLTVGGLIGYSKITDNARQAAVEKAASEVMTAAMVELNGGNYTVESVEGVADKWNDSASDNSVSSTAVVRSGSGGDCVVVKAVHKKGEVAERSNCGNEDVGSGENNDPVVETPETVSAVQNLECSVSGLLLTQVRISWDAPEGLEGEDILYEISTVRSPKNGSPITNVVETADENYLYSDSSITDLPSYEFNIVAIYDEKRSEVSTVKAAAVNPIGNRIRCSA